VRAGPGRVRQASPGGFRDARRGAAGPRPMVPDRIRFAALPGFAARVHADAEDLPDREQLRSGMQFL